MRPPCCQLPAVPAWLLTLLPLLLAKNIFRRGSERSGAEFAVPRGPEKGEANMLHWGHHPAGQGRPPFQRRDGATIPLHWWRFSGLEMVPQYRVLPLGFSTPTPGAPGQFHRQCCEGCSGKMTKMLCWETPLLVTYWGKSPHWKAWQALGQPNQGSGSIPIPGGI